MTCIKIKVFAFVFLAKLAFKIPFPLVMAYEIDTKSELKVSFHVHHLLVYGPISIVGQCASIHPSYPIVLLPSISLTVYPNSAWH